MWLEIIQDIQNKYKSGKLMFLNTNFDLHIALHIIETIKPVIKFSIKDNKLVIKKKNKIISEEEFYFWWQIVRFQEVFAEEDKLINSFNVALKQRDTLQKKIPCIIDNDPELESKKKTIKEMNKKIKKLDQLIKTEEPKFKNKIKILSNFRNSIPTQDYLTKLLKSISILLKYQKN